MKASFDATGTVVVITGGAKGIGHALAIEVAALGGTAVIFDIAEPLGEAVAGIVFVSVDVSDPDAVDAAVAGVEERFGRIDGLVAGAAIQPRTAVTEMSSEEWRRVVSVNLDGVVWVTRAVARVMRRQSSGSIVVFTSGMALTGHPLASAYVATKAALIGYAKSLAAELADARIRVNIVAPGVIDTEQFRAANEGADLEHWRSATGIGDPRDVVGPLLFLLSDASSLSGSQLTRERAFPWQDAADFEPAPGLEPEQQ
jgi:NAD(P)-dependent dehydrogenase (short-subunit alcohol dehydrogenase family)